ncbi:MAG: ABC transporter permease subunit [Planctomycetes bacterium]|nr:ABC transporter permease subunit [Planctomycetota bacterium]
MVNYFLRRFLLVIPTFLGITTLVFGIMQLVPGGPIEQAMMRLKGAGGGEAGASSAARTDVAIPADALEDMKRFYGFDKPVHVRYGLWLWNVVRLDLGKSYVYGQPVWDVIKARFPISIFIGLLGFFLTYSICIPLGILKAVRHGSAFDVLSSAIVFAGYSIPGWVAGTVLLMLFGGGSFWDVFPLRGWRPMDWEERDLWHKILGQAHHACLPVFCYMVGSFATLTILTKNSLLENLGADYVRTAFAKGLSERRVIFLHAMRNSLIPLATGIGGALGFILAGSYLIERTFSIDGMGYLGYNALLKRDFPVSLGTLVISSLLMMLGNILSDIIYCVVDPRIRFK